MAPAFDKSNLQQRRDCSIAEIYKNNYFLSNVISIRCRFDQVLFRSRVVRSTVVPTY